MARPSEQRDRTKAIIGELLKAGQIIDPVHVGQLAQIHIPDDVARMQWLCGYVRRLTYKVADENGMTVMGLGNGRGYKPMETVEERDVAEGRATAQIIGHARRKKAVKNSGVGSSQLRFALEEVTQDAEHASPAESQTASA